MLVTLSRAAYNYPLALLALCVFSHGTLLAPQVVACASYNRPIGL